MAVPGSGEVEFDLSPVPAGEHDLDSIARVPDATAKPVPVRLRGWNISGREHVEYSNPREQGG